MIQRVLAAVGILMVAACVQEAEVPQAEAAVADAAEPILTCGLPDCSVLGLVEPPPPAIAQFLARPATERIEVIALSYGQAGCPVGFPVPNDDYYAYVQLVIARLGANLGLSAAATDEYYNGLDELLFEDSTLLAAQGRLVSVTQYEDEWIPAACAG